MTLNINPSAFKKLAHLAYLVIFTCTVLNAQTVQFQDPRNAAGLSVKQSSSDNIRLDFSIHSFSLKEVVTSSGTMSAIQLPGVFLPNDEGKPDLPGLSKLIAIPQGSKPVFRILSSRVETYKDILIAPAPIIPLETDDGPEVRVADNTVYLKNSFYPENPVMLSDVTQIRGLDAVVLGVTPFQYNPVSRELLVYRDLSIEVNFVGGSGQFGDNAYRSRWFDPVLEDAILNFNSLPKIDYAARNLSYLKENATGCEYLIISPTGPEFLAWADSIKNFRIKQGINTRVVPITDAGSNNPTLLKQYITDAYNNWQIKPVAILILGDYGTSVTNSVTSPIHNNYCVSDNILGDVNNNELPDIVMARMTAQNNDHLTTFVTKFMEYEKSPPVNPDFYNKPITALGWQTERWFQVCSEVVGGFWKKKMGKNPVRINAIYSGTPSTTWSTATNTATVINYFGPGGLYYIPQTPDSLGGWSGGTAGQVTNALNAGSFMLMHRDHGAESGWGEPAYSTSNISSLTNTDLSFILSINCLTGKYNYSSEVFTERFHRYRRASDGKNSGALGLIAASEVSYSFVNDAFVWGLMDNMWTNFMPDYGTTPPSRDVRPAFGNAAGKYFLYQSSWPYNTSNKLVTYHLFHHHGDAFVNVYDNVPVPLTVNHDNSIMTGVTSFTVSADAGSFIALTVGGEIVGTAEGTGLPVAISIPGTQVPPDVMTIVVTAQNKYRYEASVPVIPNNGAYIIRDSVAVTDPAPYGNSNGVCEYNEQITLDFRVKNVGNLQADNVTITLSSNCEFVTVTDSTEVFGTITGNGYKHITGAFAFTISHLIPDGTVMNFVVKATDGTSIWNSSFSLTAHAPDMALGTVTLNDSAGNNNGKWDIGETVQLKVTFKNTGSCPLENAAGKITTASQFVTLTGDSLDFGVIPGLQQIVRTFNVTSLPTTPAGHQADFTFMMSGRLLPIKTGTFNFVIGRSSITIGQGTTSASYPFYTLYHDSRTQMIYTKNEILQAGGGAGYIAKIGFDVLTASGQLMNNFTIKMKNTTLTSITAWDNSGFTTVYSGTYTVPGTGWQELDFLERFYWDGTSNVLIEICFDNTSYTTNSTVKSFTASGQVKHNHVDNGAGCSLTGNNTVSTKPNITLVMDMGPVPVELLSFTATAAGNDVVIGWITATETNNRYFVLERKNESGVWSALSEISGNGTTSEQSSYSYTDKNLAPGSYYYRLTQVDFDGTRTPYNEISAAVGLPTDYTLFQNYPNPFNPSTIIKYALPHHSSVKISVFNSLGEKIEELVNAVQDAGYYQAEFNSSRIASGIYFYTISCQSVDGKNVYTQTRKMILMR
ncbi:MAG: T9SS type A sorting domain-containing protein [Ignavibacteriaceae bacterium]|nr:T9SS type A sorting domain-containing protein [Ignavibacteriaceae bacterium]